MCQFKPLAGDYPFTTLCYISYEDKNGKHFAIFTWGFRCHLYSWPLFNAWECNAISHHFLGLCQKFWKMDMRESGYLYLFIYLFTMLKCKAHVNVPCESVAWAFIFFICPKSPAASMILEGRTWQVMSDFVFYASFFTMSEW